MTLAAKAGPPLNAAGTMPVRGATSAHIPGEYAAAASVAIYVRMRTPVLLQRCRCGTGDIYQTMPLSAVHL